MAKTLLEWSQGQLGWVGDSLRRIAASAEHVIGEDELEKLLEGVRHYVGAGPLPDDARPIANEDLQPNTGVSPRTVLVQLGPVENIDRLAPNQTLRLAPNGITLIYGENGSGKSGYTRIAKRLCRSLSVDALRGDAFKAGQSGPKRVRVHYRVGNDDVTPLDWDPESPPPGALRQISVFDSSNARLYVDAENKIAYLPRELAILEHHGEVCQRLGKRFAQEKAALETRLKVSEPAGYTAGTRVQQTLLKVETPNVEAPSVDEFQSLSTMSVEEIAELATLERDLSGDPVAMAATRRRGAALLKRLAEIIPLIAEQLSADVEQGLRAARQEEAASKLVAQMAAAELFAAEPMQMTGEDPWRVLYVAARNFAMHANGVAADRLPDAEGELCTLCQEPLSSAGAQRLSKFNAFIHSEASLRADAARIALEGKAHALVAIVIPDVEVVTGSLTEYAAIGEKETTLVKSVSDTIISLHQRRDSLAAGEDNAPPPLDATAVCESLVSERNRMEQQAIQLENAGNSTSDDPRRLRLAELKDQAKLAQDLTGVLQRRRDIIELRIFAACLDRVDTRPVSLQISALRKALVTEELKKRIDREIAELDLAHLPLQLSERSSSGQSLFSVGLKDVGQTKNIQVLSEGEQRALALACFLAEIGDDDFRYGLIVDDPVSSLDHHRIRRVARRLVAEAAKGRQVILFTHNIVFFNEVISEAARTEGAAIIKSVIRKTQAEGFGVIEEDCEPWVADLNFRIIDLTARAKENASQTDLSSEPYRRLAKDFYSDLRETWERAVEELVLAKVVSRFVPDVMTQRLKMVCVEDDDYKIIFFAMKRVSERSGHDMAAGRDLPPPDPTDMAADLKVLIDFRDAYKKRQKEVQDRRTGMEQPAKATFL